MFKQAYKKILEHVPEILSNVFAYVENRAKGLDTPITSAPFCRSICPFSRAGYDKMKANFKGAQHTNAESYFSNHH